MDARGDGGGKAGTGILDQAWELSPSVALRPELVEVVRSLGDLPDVRTALAKAGVPTAQWGAYVKALRGLAEADMIRHRDTAGGAP